MTKRNPKDYTSIFADEYHIPIINVRQIKKYDYNKMGLFYRNKPIGYGELLRMTKKSTDVHTEGVRLERKFRNKGHGIFLYRHLISLARSIGAKRVYSSNMLNKFSRRMWEKKLPKFYTVKHKKTRKPCEACGCNQPRIERYYIDL